MGCFTKAALFIINFAIFAAGVAVVTLASVIISKDNTYNDLLVTGVFTIPIIILIVGLIILIIGFLGCCGAMKESSCMLKTYAFIIIVILIAEVTLGILLLVYPTQAEDIIKKEMNRIFSGYGSNEATDKTVDAMQSDLHCCGVNGYKDWQNYPYGQGGDKNVSKGCCLEDDKSDTCFQNMNELPESQAVHYIYTGGCFDALKEDLHDVTIGLGVVLFILAIVQVLAVTCACGIAKKAGGTHYA